MVRNADPLWIGSFVRTRSGIKQENRETGLFIRYGPMETKADSKAR